MWVLDLFLFESSDEFPPSPILRVLSMLDKIQIKFVKLVCFGYEYTFAHTITSKLLEVFYLPAGKINFYIICTSVECKTNCPRRKSKNSIYNWILKTWSESNWKYIPLLRYFPDLHVWGIFQKWMPVSVTKQIELHKSQVYFSKITFILEKILDKLICIGNMLKYFYCFGSQTTRGYIHINFLTKLEDKITHVGIIIMRLKKKTVGLA